ncbi:class I SAM-dependent methyltransferase [Marinimicrobium sp. ABcell2]|uniref:class I SAM-dependent methyltransferase n=1 Tax=Marinimicrobium sp. ABcell2 TaxID=3069751 RepID=UPI0027B7FBFD|nr:methyltransferase domain-containing protein [Marinimicrobium sp. ABcell2]MDQ2076884.1 methyltransferase domain-containing protein [Marinimicrobium sp. ABcell2]
MDNKSLASSRTRARETNWQAFFAGFLRNPQEVGSVIPSSRFLEQRILDAADLTEARLVVELGPGTGGTTQAILSSLPGDAKLLTIDMSNEFIDLLNENISDSRLINHLGSAADLSRILKEYNLSAPDAVISGIPFSTMPKEVGANVVKAVREELREKGRFVAYQFRGEVATITRPFMGEPVSSTEWRNVPPMRVYCWKKAVTNSQTSN